MGSWSSGIEHGELMGMEAARGFEAVLRWFMPTQPQLRRRDLSEKSLKAHSCAIEKRY